MGRKDTLLSFKKFIAAFMVFAMLLALAGCVRYSVGCTVNSDGTVNLTYLYALSDLTDSNGDSGWEEEKKQFTSKGWATRDYTGDGGSDSSSYNGFIASKGGIPIDEVETEIHALGEGFELFTLTYDDGVYTLDWDTESVNQMVSDGGSSMGDLATYGGYMKFSLELPNKPISENATKTKGSVMEWDLSKVNEPVHCEFELPKAVIDDVDEDEDEEVSATKSKKKSSSSNSSTNVVLLIIVSVICLALVIGAVVLIVFIVKKKKKETFTAPITVPAHAPQPKQYEQPQQQSFDPLQEQVDQLSLPQPSLPQQSVDPAQPALTPPSQPTFVPPSQPQEQWIPTPYSSTGLPDPMAFQKKDDNAEPKM